MENTENSQSSNKTDKALEFGEYLKNIRIKAGFSVDRVSSATKIGRDFIEALERGQIDKLPGRIFARGFLRNLCRNYQTPVDELLEKFEAAFGTEAVVQEQVVNPTPTDKEVETRKILGKIEKKVWFSGRFEKLPLSHYFHTVPLLTMGVVSVILIVGIYYLTDGPTVAKKMPVKSERAKIVAEAERQPETADTTEPESSEMADAESDIVPVPNPDMAIPPSTDQTMPQHVGETPLLPVDVVKAAGENNVGQQLLKLSVSAAVKVKVAFDKGAYEIKQLEPGEHKFEFNSEAKMLIYDASALKVSYNGKDLGELGKPGRIRRLSFKKDSEGKSKTL